MPQKGLRPVFERGWFCGGVILRGFVNRAVFALTFTGVRGLAEMREEKMWGSEQFWGLGFEFDPQWVLSEAQKNAATPDHRTVSQARCVTTLWRATRSCSTRARISKPWRSWACSVYWCQRKWAVWVRITYVRPWPWKPSPVTAVRAPLCVTPCTTAPSPPPCCGITTTTTSRQS